jgi:hypothetical protein
VEKENHLRRARQINRHGHSGGSRLATSFTTTATSNAARKAGALVAACALSDGTPGISSHHCRADAAKCDIVSAAASAAASGTCRHRAVHAPTYIQKVQKALITQRGFLSTGGSLFAFLHTFPHGLLFSLLGSSPPRYPEVLYAMNFSRNTGSIWTRGLLNWSRVCESLLGVLRRK